MAKAQAVADALMNRLELLGKPPVAFDRWEEARPGYGSDAWVAYGNDDEIALERREFDDERFA